MRHALIGKTYDDDHDGFFRDHMPEYRLEEKDRNPVLRRKGIPLIFSSARKPDPTQLNSGE